jgi:Flp pilus assembly protein TadG
MPLLLTMVLGIVEFGRVYNVQTTLSAAAREGVRTMALQNNAAAARTSTKSAATPAVSLTDTQISVSPGTCPVNGTATVTVTYPLPYITNFFGTSITLTGKGVMRCNG